MSLFKRLSITLFSGLDDMVTSIENHDALIEAAIAEQQQKIGTARHQLLRLSKQKQTAVEKISDLDIQQNQWQKRAMAAGQQDEMKALSCLQRRRAILQQIESHSKSRDQFTNAVNKLSTDIRISENDLAEVKQKRELLKAQQSSSEVLQHLDNRSLSSQKQMKKTFERWESNIAESHPYLIDLVDNESLVDHLEQEFVEKEQKQSLKNELAVLLAKKGEGHE